MRTTLWQRSCGILLHPTSLLSPFAVGDLGPGAESYVEWLGGAGVGWWQVLPLNPPGPGHSPYSATSAFAGNEWLISPERLVEDGLLANADIADRPSLDAGEVDYPAVFALKSRLFDQAFQRLRSKPPRTLLNAFREFRERHHSWLEDYALFAALKAEHGGAPWFEWERDLAHRAPAALARARDSLSSAIARAEVLQFLFFRQLDRLRTAARDCGVRILGDVPIFMARDSADVWSHPELFLLDRELRPTVVAGVPPDYFSATGQLWGNPLYDWDRHRAEGYTWWIARMRHTLSLVDAVRLDHFRGFAAHWEVPAADDVATNGRWVRGPGRSLFDSLEQALGGLPLVAEDLGEITEDVIELRRELGLPGMAILQFGFSIEPRSSFIPYNHTPDLVVYTGTHDNNTTVGWLEQDLRPEEKDLAMRYAASDGSAPHWDFVRLALASVAGLAIIPHQDLAGLGSHARMNTPGRCDGNWRFRLTPAMLDKTIQDRLADMVWIYGRGKPRRRRA